MQGLLVQGLQDEQIEGAGEQGIGLGARHRIGCLWSRVGRQCIDYLRVERR